MCVTVTCMTVTCVTQLFFPFFFFFPLCSVLVLAGRAGRVTFHGRDANELAATSDCDCLLTVTCVTATCPTVA